MNSTPGCTQEPSSIALLSNVDTKIAVAQALEQLMEEQLLDKIPVSAICKRAGISRATFYRYFTDKFSIVQWYVSYIHHTGANEIGRTMSWFEGYYSSELTVSRHISFFRNAAKSNDYNSLDRYAPRLRIAALERTITEFHGIELTEKLRFMVNATVQSEVHLFPDWHYGNYDCTLEEACAWMVECVPTELRELLEKPIDPRKAPQGYVSQIELSPDAPTIPGAPGY